MRAAQEGDVQKEEKDKVEVNKVAAARRVRCGEVNSSNRDSLPFTC